MKNFKYIVFAFLAALLYAICTPVSKYLLESNISGPTSLAGILYLGAGIGSGILFIFSKKKDKTELLDSSDTLYVILMIVLDILAPIMLMYGIKYSPSSSVSLLNNFEIVATSMIAYIFFKEDINKKTLISIIIIVIACSLLCINIKEKVEFSVGSILVILASCCWGLENNCTRKLSNKNKKEVVMVKGLACGMSSIIIALIIGDVMPEVKYFLMILVLGFLTYGLSILLYIFAQEHIGAAKTSAFYAINPFISALISFIFLSEKITYIYIVALVFMILGSLILVIDTLKNEKEENV